MRLYLALLLLTASPAVALNPAHAQSAPAPAGRAAIVYEQLDREGTATLPALEVVVEAADYRVDGRRVEALILRPMQSADPSPALFMIPGHGRSARDNLPLAAQFARAGYVVMTVAQPGYGQSEGAPDFVGPATIAALIEGAKILSNREDVDPARVGVYGYSRGALAAALMAVRTSFFRAAIFGGGIYDFETAYNEIQLEGIRANMATEAGLSAEAVAARSPLREMERLEASVLILHGGQDANAPLSQAQALKARLAALGKPHDLVIIPGGDHALSVPDVLEPALSFLSRTLGQPRTDGREGRHS